MSILNSDRIELGKFNILLADPPHRYKNWSMKESAQRGEKWARRNGRSPYDTMDLKDICDLPVNDIMARNSVLFLWVTDPKLDDGFKIIEAWGFTYVSVGFYWVKQNPSGVGFHFGLGFGTRANPEICLQAKRGKGLRRVDNSVPRLLISPLQEHSRKPDEIRERIVRLVGDLPRIELFARRRAPNWITIGNGIDGLDIKDSINRIICTK